MALEFFNSAVEHPIIKKVDKKRRKKRGKKEGKKGRNRFT
jgi:hypothetical protein